MRKNKMMRLASSLLVAVLITTSTISGTFAKYTTQDKASDAARVAKWGVELQVAGDLYGANYFDGTNGNKATAGEDNLSVKSSSAPAENVVAPGTLNDDGFSFFLKGTPEVKSNVDVTIWGQNIFLVDGVYGVMVAVPAGKITAENYPSLMPELFVESATDVYSPAAGVFDNGKTYYTLEDKVDLDVNADSTYDDAYYPVVYTLHGATTNGSPDIQTDSLKAASDAILTAAYGGASAIVADMSTDKAYYSKTISKVYDVNTNLETTLKLNDTYLTWAWAFGNPDLKGDNASMTDMADTILGNLIAEEITSDVVMFKEGVYKTVAVQTVPKTPGVHEAYKFAKVGNDIVACLTTQFSIDITVTQVN